MSKFCNNCGYSLPDDAAFCFSCGAKQEEQQPFAQAPVVEQPVQEPVYNQPAYEYPVSEQTYVQPEQPQSAFVPFEDSAPKKKRVGLWVTLSIILVLILAIIGGVVYSVIGYNNASDAISEKISEYVNLVYICEDPETANDMIPEIIDENLKTNAVKNRLEVRSRAMDNYFGSNISVKYECEDIEWVCPSEYYYYVDIIESTNDIVIGDIDAIYRVYFDVFVEGKKGDAEYTVKMFAIQLDDEWYLFNMDTYQFAGYDIYGGYGIDMDEDIGLDIGY